MSTFETLNILVTAGAVVAAGASIWKLFTSPATVSVKQSRSGQSVTVSQHPSASEVRNLVELVR